MGKYWVQADAVLIDADDPIAAIAEYRRLLAGCEIACSTGKHCAALQCVKQGNPTRYAHLMSQQQCLPDDSTASMET